MTPPNPPPVVSEQNKQKAREVAKEIACLTMANLLASEDVETILRESKLAELYQLIENQDRTIKDLTMSRENSILQHAVLFGRIATLEVQASKALDLLNSSSEAFDSGCSILYHAINPTPAQTNETKKG